MHRERPRTMFSAASPRSTRHALTLEMLERRDMLTTHPVISEFLARNDGGLRDGWGRTSDWIELFNPGEEPINLAGYRLTDDPNNLAKWVFPDVVLESGGYEIVFASGKQDGEFKDASGRLHTNFTLKRGGDYLGLIAPDGTVLSEFGPDGTDFPEQHANVSYGVAQSMTLIDPSSEVAYMVPLQSLGSEWTTRDFDAAAHGFSLGAAAIGSESQPEARVNFVGHFETELPDRTHGVYVRAEFELGDAAAITDLKLRMKYDNGFVAYLNGTRITDGNAPAIVDWFSSAASSGPRDAVALEYVEFDLTGSVDLLVSGTNVLAIHGLNHPRDDSDLLLVPELVAGASDVSSAFGQQPRLGYMTSVTPGAPNVASSHVFTDFLADTKFSVDRGFFSEPFTVEVSTGSENASIYYTTDGSEPWPDNPTASRYSAPLPIDGTTTLRAAAFRPGYVPSNIDTQTYLFLDQVIRQDPPRGEKYPATWQSRVYTGDYQMDAEVVTAWNDNRPDNRDFGIRESLRSLPTISIVMDHADLWGEQTGIYNHATATGEEWRRPGSVEYFDPATGDEFQIDAGIQMHGGASRDNLRTKKHSFRLLFRGDFGPTSLSFPLFNGSNLDELNTVVLKSFFTDGFSTRTVNGRYSPLDSQYLRDTWMRDSQLAMGSLSAHSEYAHLYINGLYWGLYSPTERPDEDFLAAYLGGEAEDFDIVKDFNDLFAGERSAWDEMFQLANQGLASDADYQRIQGNNPDGSPNPDLPNLLDVENLIDYMLLHLFAGAEDWPHHNWYAGRARVGETKGFQFYTWDQEIVLDGFFRDRNDSDSGFSPARLFQRLRQNAEFRLRFADRVHKHLFGGGALTVEASRERWRQRANQIERAIIAESARWGDAREGEIGQSGVRVPTMTVDPWRVERDNVHDNYFPRSHELALQRFRSDDLYPQLDAPTFNRHGGVVSRDFDIRIDAPGATVYYTVDGTDPRLAGAVISPNAVQHMEALRISTDTTIKARALVGDEWSALTQAHFAVSSELPLRISELNYKPHEPNLVPGLAETDADNDRFEFVELINVGEQAIDLAGVEFVQQEVNGDRQGIEFRFASQMLAPQERIVVVRDLEAFRSRYGNSIRVASGHDGKGGLSREYDGRLSNNGERITLLDNAGLVIQQFSYAAGIDWQPRADARGSSLEIIDVSASYDDPDNWRASVDFGGSPGRDARETADQVVFNEILADPSAATTVVELRNLTGSDVDVTGWYISDDDEDLFHYRLADSAMVPATGYAVISGADIGLNLDSSVGGHIWLVATNDNGMPWHFADDVQFGPSDDGVSVGPRPDSDREWVPLAMPTLGAPNSGPLIGDVVITEVHYHPLDPDGQGLLTPDDTEFIELYNRTNESIDISGWQLLGDVEFSFPNGAVVPPASTLVVVAFDPAQANMTNVFSFAFDLPANSTLWGPFSHNLRDAGGSLRLTRPIETQAVGSGQGIRITADEVKFHPDSPWPVEAAGGGASIHRLQASALGTQAENWAASTPSPHAVDFVVRQVGDSNQDGRFDQLDIVTILQGGKYLTGLPATWSEGDWNSDGVFDQLDLVDALGAGTYLGF